MQFATDVAWSGGSLEYLCSVVVGDAEEVDAIHLQYLVTHLA